MEIATLAWSAGARCRLALPGSQKTSRDDALTTTAGFLLALALIPAFWPLSASAAPEDRAAICAGYRGTALWGQCTRAVENGCDETESAHRRCEQWAQRWRDQTGLEPPWLLLCGDAFGSKCVFVTSDGYSGEQVGRLDGADQKCADEAKAEGSLAAPGTYKAWLSTSGSFPAGTRFTHPTVPYVRVDGVEVAASFAALTSAGRLDAPLSVTATGQLAGGQFPFAWTGTLRNGTPSNATCADWRSIFPDGRAGRFDDPVGWTDLFDSGCANRHALYCFQQ